MRRPHWLIEGRRKVQDGHVVQKFTLAVVRVHQHIARLRAAIGSRLEWRPALRTVQYLQVTRQARPAYNASLHRRSPLIDVNLPGGNRHTDGRQEHGPGGARRRVYEAVRGRHDDRSTHDRPPAQD